MALPQAAPNPRPRRRRRGRRGNGRTANLGAVGSSNITISDAEIVDLPDTGVTIQMNCSALELPRLAAHGKMYERYRILSLGVDYIPLSGVATEGNIRVAIVPGPKRDSINDKTVLKVQPLLMRPGWKAGSLQAGRNLDSQKFMHVGKTDEEGVAATIYAYASKASLGTLRVRYTVQFSFPIPF